VEPRRQAATTRIRPAVVPESAVILSRLDAFSKSENSRKPQDAPRERIRLQHGQHSSRRLHAQGSAQEDDAQWRRPQESVSRAQEAT